MSAPAAGALLLYMFANLVESPKLPAVVVLDGPAGEYQLELAAVGLNVVIVGTARISTGNCQLTQRAVELPAFIDIAPNAPVYPVF